MVAICMVGEGAIADTHLRSLSEMPEAAVVSLVCGNAADGAAFGRRWNIPTVGTDLARALEDPIVDAVVIASPSALHASQAEIAIQAGKHVLIEIPIGLDLPACNRLAERAAATNRIVLACHTRRFSPAHRYLHEKAKAGEFALQHLVAETYFFRRTNLNMHGQARSWVDSLLWHHACHSIDLFIWQTGDTEPESIVQIGPLHPKLGIPMDMTIGLRARSGALLTLALSFNNRGPFGGFYRYIGDSGTYHVFRDELRDDQRCAVEVCGDAFVDQDRAFIDAIMGRGECHPTIEECLPAMRVIDDIARQIAAKRSETSEQ